MVACARRAQARGMVAGEACMPLNPPRETLRTSSEASPRSKRSERVRLVTAPDLKLILALASRQNHTVWAASHSRSRTKMCCDLADWRQSIAEEESGLA